MIRIEDYTVAQRDNEADRTLDIKVEVNLNAVGHISRKAIFMQGSPAAAEALRDKAVGQMVRALHNRVYGTLHERVVALESALRPILIAPTGATVKEIDDIHQRLALLILELSMPANRPESQTNEPPKLITPDAGPDRQSDGDQRGADADNSAAAGRDGQPDDPAVPTDREADDRNPEQ